MGFRSFMSKTIMRMDLLSATPTFRTRNESQYETIFGGVLSLMIMIAAFYVMYVQFVDMVNNLQITYSTGISEDIDSSTTVSDIQFAVTIGGVNLAQSPKKFIFQLYQISIVAGNGGAVTTKTQINLSPCVLSDWQSLGTNFKRQYSVFSFNQMLCIQNGQSYQLSGYAGSDIFQYLQFQIVMCNQTLDPTCDTPANINTYITNYLSHNDYFQVRFFLVDTIITPQNSDAITKVIEKNIFMAFTKTIGTVGYINMAQYTLESDTSILPNTQITELTGSYIQSFQTNSVSISSTNYVNVYFFKSTKGTSISRTIGKIDVVLSYVGGLFGILFTALAFCIGSYSEMQYQMSVARQIMVVDQSGKKVSDEDFGFVTYIAYCCYDWMDSLCIAPQCLTHLRAIHEVRQQTCQQLNPALILKRIKYLEDVSKVLLSQHRQMSLYLAAPMTIQQNRKMRNSLSFYDRLLSQVGQQSLKVQQQKYIDIHNINALQNESEEMQRNKISQKPQLIQEQQEYIFKKLMRQSIALLEKDKSQIGKKIKDRVAKKVLMLLKQSSQSQANEVENRVEIRSPKMVQDESKVRLQRVSEISSPKKMMIKRAKR